MLAFVPIALHIQDEAGSGIAVAAMFVALWSPMFFFAGPAGLLVDRTSRGAFCSWRHWRRRPSPACSRSPPRLRRSSCSRRCSGSARPSRSRPSSRSSRASPAATIRRANSFIETSRALGFGLGPFAGGLLAAAGGMKLGLLVDAATFLVIAGVSLLPPCYACAGRARASFGRARDGIVFLVRDDMLRLVLSVGSSRSCS